MLREGHNITFSPRHIAAFNELRAANTEYVTQNPGTTLEEVQAANVVAVAAPVAAPVPPVITPTPTIIETIGNTLQGVRGFFAGGGGGSGRFDHNRGR